MYKRPLPCAVQRGLALGAIDRDPILLKHVFFLPSLYQLIGHTICNTYRPILLSTKAFRLKNQKKEITIEHFKRRLKQTNPISASD